MSSHQSVILLEFNELTPALLDRFMNEGVLPNFRRLYNEADVFVTDAEESGKTLNPWVQWVTVHSGLAYADHGVFRLDEGRKLSKKCVWDLVSDAGKRAWICGSMNVRYDLPFNGAVLPDPWSSRTEPFPDSLGSFYRFVQTSVQEHTNERVPLTKRDYAAFLIYLLRHGLSPSTAFAIGRQLLRERGGRFKWKRVAVLDRLQWDVFRWHYRAMKPHFSTLFSNSVAHLQHAYWRNMDPESFSVRPTAVEQDEFQPAVQFGYEETDKLVGRVLKLADKNTTVILCTALSQMPCLTFEESGGKHFYRPYDFDRLLAFAGISEPSTVSPVMSEQFHVRLASDNYGDDAEARLRGLEVDGRPALKVERNQDGLFAGSAIFDDLPEDAVLETADGKSCSFFDIFYKAETTKSGMHHPDGVLWIRTPTRAHRVHKEKVPLRSIAPTILRILGMTPPDDMAAAPLELSEVSTVPNAALAGSAARSIL